MSTNYTLHHGDCVEFASQMEDCSVHYSIFSPPFVDLYTYSDDPRDMGNCRGSDEFIDHFSYLADQLHRVIMPGRLVSIHCMDLPTYKWKDGYIGLSDFPGDLIRAMQAAGFVYHSRVTIWKDPVVAMQRTKAKGLLHKQLVKDSSCSRQGIADYVLTMRKHGDNPEPIAGRLDKWIGDPCQKPKMGGDPSIDIWQRYASPVWSDINQSRTLQKTSARADKDEKHICPLQLDVIDRCLDLWTNAGDLVFSPFAGIGSEGYCALMLGRRFVGAELKKSYYEQAIANLAFADSMRGHDLFAEANT